MYDAQDSNSQAIHYVHRATKEVREEKVYGGAAVRFLYNTGPGFLAERTLLSRAPFSKLYGWYNDSVLSARRIAGFVQDFQIDLSQFDVPAAGFKSFNDFFIRKYKSGVRPFPKEAAAFGSPAEGRVLAYQNIDIKSVFPVKGRGLVLETLLQDQALARKLAGGAAMVVRLCPVDYHRYHFPDGGVASAARPVAGALHSVNPMALARIPQLFQENERVVTVLDSQHFGTVVLVEVGAMMVGRMTQTYVPGAVVQRGQEKGYFTFGGSTVLVFVEPGRMKIDRDLLENTAKGLETYIMVGEAVGRSGG